MASKAWGWGLAALGIAIAAGTIGYSHAPRFWGLVAASPSDGHIIVNSPSIYTRQRLVNDRLSQTAWLKDQLAVTTNALGRFNAINQVLVTESVENLAAQLRIAARAAAVGVAPGGGTPPAAGAQGGNAAPGGGASAGQGAAPSTQNAGSGSLTIPDRPAFRAEQTTTDMFHALNNYREEIRSEMMQTLLDDRHDIQGNTIYRLALDATVLAGRGANDLAVVSATLRHDPVKFEADYEDVYDEWARFIQKTVNQSLEGLAKSLAERVPETRVRLMMSRFLVQELCRLVLQADGALPDNNQAARIECNVWAMRPNNNVRRASQLLDEYVDEYLKGREEIAKGRFRRDLEIAKFPLKPEDFLYLYEFARRDCRSRDPFANPKTTVAPQTSLLTSDGQSVQLNCPIFTPPFEGLVGGLVLYESLMRMPSLLADLLKASPAILGKDLFRITNHSVCAPSNGGTICLPREPKLAQLRCVAADYIRWSLNGFGNPFTTQDEQIETYLDMYTVGRALEDCNVAVVTKEPKDRTASLLRENLNAASEVYAYNVSPRNLSRRVASSVSTRRAIQALFGAQGSAGPAEVGATVDNSRRRAEQREEIEAQPFIVAFGRGRNAHLGAIPYTTDFGWAIAPRRNENDQEYDDGQHALAAVVSMPGWWRSVELKITTCWISRAALKHLANIAAAPPPTAGSVPPSGGASAPARGAPAAPPGPTPAQVKDLCSAGQSLHEQTELVRVPGTIQEVSRKLGFEVVQEPNLDDAQLMPQVLQVGYGGDILLTGGRLWRSTEITVGSQAADRIAVLPNMRGIIATFNCVRPQFPWDVRTGQRMEAEVKVWTSEGMTQHPNIVQLEIPDGSKPIKGAKPCPPEKWAGPPDPAPSRQPAPTEAPPVKPATGGAENLQPAPVRPAPVHNAPPSTGQKPPAPGPQNPPPQPALRPQQPLPDPGPPSGG